MNPIVLDGAEASLSMASPGASLGARCAEMEIDAGIIVFVLMVVMVAATAQTVAGFGFALLAVPVLVTVLDVRDAVVVSTLLGILNSGILAVSNRAHVPWGTVGPMLAGAIAGMPAGLLILLLAPAAALRLLVGVVTFAMTAALLRGLRFGSKSMPSELAVGALSGALSTSTGTNGPPVVLYLQGREFPAPEFRAALAVFFLSCNVIALGSFFVTGIVTQDALVLFAVATPAIAVGSIAGHGLVQHVEPEAFRRLVFGLLFTSALAAVASAVQGLV